MTKDEFFYIVAIWTCYGIVLAASEISVFGILYLLEMPLNSIFTAAIGEVFTILLLFIYRAIFEKMEISKKNLDVFFKESIEDLLRFNLILWIMSLIVGMSFSTILTASCIFIISSIII